MRHFILFLTLTSFLISGCTKDSPEVYKTPDPVARVELTPGVIEPGKGISKVRLGQSQKEVEAVLGAPNELDTNEYSPGQVYALYYQRGIELVYADSKLEAITLHSAEKKWSAFTGGTADGLGVGSTAAEILEKMGEPEEDSPKALRYQKLGLWFRLDSDKSATDRTARAHTVTISAPEL